jgi:hypothetical protein
MLRKRRSTVIRYLKDVEWEDTARSADGQESCLAHPTAFVAASFAASRSQWLNNDIFYN